MDKFKKYITVEVGEKLKEVVLNNHRVNLSVERKPDRSLVTEMDYFISQKIKDYCQSGLEPIYKVAHFYSEEDHGDLNYPAIILDPIDGTFEFVHGIPQCSLSFSYMETPDVAGAENHAWVFNPYTGFSIDHKQVLAGFDYEQKPFLSGFVSNTEFKNGLYKNEILSPTISLAPVGSIAFKLALLASGACDFVVSKKPKNIWDIAAGTILCRKSGIFFYQDFKEVRLLNTQSYDGLLLWARPSFLERLKIFQK